MTIPQPVVVLLGGHAAEREISLKSGRAVCAALERQQIAYVAIDPAECVLADALRDAKPAVVFIALHGPGGEDGTMQGFLETLGLSYTGSGVMASALAMDKLRTKQLWVGAGLPTPAFAVLKEGMDWEGTLRELGGVVMVKPACEGSSIGMSKADSAQGLYEAWALASRYGDSVIAERWITGSEYTIAILDDKALPVIRVEVPGSAFYDFEAKYQSNQTRYCIPCGLTDAEERELQELALQAYRALGCAGWGRVDVLRDQAGAFYLLEANTVPGMTDHSLVPMAAKAAGMDFDALVLAIIAGASPARRPA
ncbi:MAG: D-alanine--D-alanine ligase [Gammaproteobacteria bacterium]|nr:MAG: D-alanine--D-alanine ligase [Gammaproteobacteria bacterium]